MSKVYQQILRGARSCNRGIRYRRLRPSEVDEVRLKAAKIVAGENTPDDERWNKTQLITLHEGVKAMLVSVTRDEVPLPARVPLKDAEGQPILGKDGVQQTMPGDEPTLTDLSLWEPLTLEKLSMTGKFSYDEVFESPDVDYLTRLWRYNHEASPEDVGNILKKEQRVSTD
jgi:hypothetical protein